MAWLAKKLNSSPASMKTGQGSDSAIAYSDTFKFAAAIPLRMDERASRMDTIGRHIDLELESRPAWRNR
jgi:hypothetical protein